MKHLEGYADGYEALVDYLLRVLDDPGTVRRVRKRGNYGALIAAAFVQMSQDVHPPDDRASYYARRKQ